MSSEDIFEAVQHLLERELTADERRFLTLAYPAAEHKDKAMASVAVCRDAPASSMRAAKHLRVALVLAACTLLALCISHRPLAASPLPASSAQQANHDPGTTQQSAVAAPASENQPVPPSHEPERVLLPAGTVISVRIADQVDSNHFHSGDLLTGIVDPSLIYNDRVLIPRGTEAHVRMVEDKKGGHLHGKAEVELELIGLVMNGRKLDVESDTYEKQKGALAAKVQAAAAPAAGAGVNDAAGTDPGSAASPIIAIFRAAKVQLPPDTRVKFTLTEPFRFVKPPIASAE